MVRTCGPLYYDDLTQRNKSVSYKKVTDGSGEFTVPSIFGETSAEVCGVYGVNGKGSGVTTNLPTVADAVGPYEHSYRGITEVTADGGSATLTFSSDTNNMYVNGVKFANNTTKTYHVAKGKQSMCRLSHRQEQNRHI